MKYVARISRLLITASGLLALTITAGLSDNLQVIPNKQVRVTTGIGTVQGWEQGLVQKNPNLGRWHWDPIYYYKQGYGPVSQRKQNFKGGSRPTSRQSNTVAPNSTYPNYRGYDSRPIHIPYSPQVNAELQGRLMLPKNSPESDSGNKDSVLGRLMPPADPVVATYGNVLPYNKNQINTGLKYNSQHTAVYGQVLNAGSANRSKNKNIITHKRLSVESRVSGRMYDAQKNR